MNSTPILEVRGLTKSFDGVVALDHIELSLNKGDSMVVIGGSGSGKTLLLKCILGVIAPDAGNVLVEGKETIGLSERARRRFLERFGMQFQQSALFDSMPVWRNIAFKALKSPFADRKAGKALAVELLESVGLRPEVADLYPAELSGGMQKRVGLARAFAGHPEFLFLDEPTAGLDPIMSNAISELIAKLSRDHGVTSIVVSSDLASARKVCNRAMMLHQGRKIWEGASEELDHSGNPYVEQFVHKSAEGPIAVLTE